jgi:hypothetical protein
VDDTPDIEATDDDAPASHTKALLIGLAGLGVIALVLVAVRATRAPQQPNPVLSDVPLDGDWRTSLQHLADAFQARCDGLEARLDDLVSERVRAAATSTVAEPLVERDEPPTPNGVTAGVSEAEPGTPPGPASVSVQP